MKRSPLVCSLAAAVLVPFAAHGALKAGFVARDITPDIGMEVPGGYCKAFSKQIHDPCKVRVAVFDDGKKRVALVGIDALFIGRDVVLAAREAIEKKCGIPGDCVMVGASHSHSSGPIGMILPGMFDGDSELVKDLAYNKSSNGDLGYVAKVRDAIVAGVV